MKKLFLAVLLVVIFTLTIACGHSTGPGLTSPSIDFYCPGTDQMYNQIFGGFPYPPDSCYECHIIF